MRTIFRSTTAYAFLVMLFMSCSSAQDQKKVEKAAEEQVRSDEEKLDSMNKAVMQQIESVPEDSVVKTAR
jgi:hypothetical protein